MTMKITAQDFATVCQGNAGALTVLVECQKFFGDEWTLHFMGTLVSTDTKSLALWLIYKDECAGDLGKAKIMFENWMDQPSQESLLHWIVKEGLRSAKEAAYYLEN